MENQEMQTPLTGQPSVRDRIYASYQRWRHRLSGASGGTTNSLWRQRASRRRDGSLRFRHGGPLEHFSSSCRPQQEPQRGDRKSREAVFRPFRG